MSISICVPGISGKMGMEIAKLVSLDNANIILSSGVVRDVNKISQNLSNFEQNFEQQIITQD